jgi:hypothetical protein
MILSKVAQDQKKKLKYKKKKKKIDDKEPEAGKK